jgi:hypothetical protein
MFKEHLLLGIYHVLSPDKYHHLLFLMAISAVFAIRDWKKMVMLFSGFTLGHSLTLLLALGHITSFSTHWIGIFIPVTILMTSIQNLVRLSDMTQNRISLYPLVLSFGFMDGLRISNALTDQFGISANIFEPLLAYCLGIEVGQIGVMVVLMGLTYALTGPGFIKSKHLIVSLSILTAVLSLFSVIIHIWT